MTEDVKKEELSEFDQLQQKSDEYLNNWKRAAADFANYKKEEVERIGFLAQYAKESVIEKILPVLDSIALAQASIPESIKKNTWSEGFFQIEKQIAEFLKKEGIEQIEVIGKQFDPATMEAVGEVEAASPEVLPGTVTQEVQRGYKMGEKVMRPAMVKISK